MRIAVASAVIILFLVPEVCCQPIATQLEDGVAVADCLDNVSEIHYYSIDVPTGATSLTVRLEGAGDINLNVGTTLTENILTYEFWSYGPTSDDVVEITHTSLPPLDSQSVWYIALEVYTIGCYALTASIDDPEPPPVTIPLTLDVPFGAYLNTGSTLFFELDVPPNVGQLEITLEGTGNMDLFVGSTATVFAYNYEFYSGNVDTSEEFLLIGDGLTTSMELYRPCYIAVDALYGGGDFTLTAHATELFAVHGTPVSNRYSIYLQAVFVVGLGMLALKRYWARWRTIQANCFLRRFKVSRREAGYSRKVLDS